MRHSLHEIDDEHRQSRHWLPGLILIGVAMLGASPAAGQSPGCCLLDPRGCVSTGQQTACERRGGVFFADRACNSAATACVLPGGEPPVRRSRRQRPLSFFRRVPARAVRPHGPHVVLVPAVTATPFRPTPTATATPPPFVGCCQLDSLGPECVGNVDVVRCQQAGGTLIADTACDRASGFCISSPPPTCGDGVVDFGEECERDSDCGNPNEGCTAACQCVGGVEVVLRWSNHNDVNLSLIDPFGNVYVPAADANRECRATVINPEEFVFLPPGEAPIGCYTLRAHYADRCPASGPVDTHLDFRLNVEGTRWTIHDVPGPVPGEIYETLFGLRATCP